MSARPVVVVTGATGYLGTRLVHLLAERAEVHAVGRAEGVDVTDRVGVHAALRELEPDAVIHAAAANPGRPPEQFDPVNRLGTTAVAESCGARRVRLVHVSTDVVFDGRSAPYTDDATTAPINDYGRSKAAAEEAVAMLAPGSAIVRTSLIYGVHAPDRSTAGFIERLQSGGELRLFEDVLRQPVFVDALAGALITLAIERTDVAGTLNVAGSQVLDRASFGRRMLQYWGIDGGDRVVDASAADLPDVPLDLRLTLHRARSLGLPCPSVDEVLATHPR